MVVPIGPAFLEVFAGAAGLSQAISARGLQILPPIEINTNQFVHISVDILEPQVQQHVIKLIRAKVIAFIHFGIPCSSFSIARKDDGGPPPLRNRMYLWGIPGLAPRNCSWVTSSCTSPCSGCACSTKVVSAGRLRTLPALFFGKCRLWSS